MTSQAYAAEFEQISGVGGLQIGEVPGTTLERFFSILLGFLTLVGGIAFLVYFVLGAINWISSGGDREKVSRAQRYMSNALIGLIFVVVAWALTGVIGRALGFNILELAASLGKIGP